MLTGGDFVGNSNTDRKFISRKQLD